VLNESIPRALEDPENIFFLAMKLARKYVKQPAISASSYNKCAFLLVLLVEKNQSPEGIWHS
jgi:hypothetical protein